MADRVIAVAKAEISRATSLIFKGLKSGAYLYPFQVRTQYVNRLATSIHTQLHLFIFFVLNLYYILRELSTSFLTKHYANPSNPASSPLSL